MADRTEDRAQRVESILETGDVEGAMSALQREMSGLSPQERGQVLRSLKEQNEKANSSSSIQVVRG